MGLNTRSLMLKYNEYPMHLDGTLVSSKYRYFCNPTELKESTFVQYNGGIAIESREFTLTILCDSELGANNFLYWMERNLNTSHENSENLRFILKTVRDVGLETQTTEEWALPVIYTGVKAVERENDRGINGAVKLRVGFFARDCRWYKKTKAGEIWNSAISGKPHSITYDINSPWYFSAVMYASGKVIRGVDITSTNSDSFNYTIKCNGGRHDVDGYKKTAGGTNNDTIPEVMFLSTGVFDCHPFQQYTFTETCTNWTGGGSLPSTQLDPIEIWVYEVKGVPLW